MKRVWVEMADHAFWSLLESPPNFRVDRGLVSKVVFLKFEHDPRNIIKSNTFQCQIDWKFFFVKRFSFETVTVLSMMRLESGHGIVRISDVKTDLKNH